MKKIILLFLILTTSISFAFGPEGNLEVTIFSQSAFEGIAPGETITYMILYTWDGEQPATNIEIRCQFPSEIDLTSTIPQATQNGNELRWSVPTFSSTDFGFITIVGQVKSDVSMGSTITCSATITGDVNDTDSEDNQSSVDVPVQSTSIPDLWVMKFGLMESIESGSFFTTEKGIAASFDLHCFNMSKAPAPDVVLIDSLPEGLEFISAEPAPSSVSGNMVTWNLNTMDAYQYSKVIVNVRPTQSGSFINTANISSSAGDRNPLTNRSQFYFSVVNVLQPVLLKPSVRFGDDEVIMMGSNPKFEGMAKAGSKITLYEGDSTGTFGDFANLHPKEIMSTITGSDRKWQMNPSTLTENRTYFLYLQAEYDGEKSAPFMNYWMPIKLRIEPLFDLAGFDMDNFVVQTGETQYHPGALGGTSSGTPDEDLRIVKRFKAPASILTDTSLWKNHLMRLVVTEDGETTEEIWRLSEVRPVGKLGKTGNTNNPDDHVEYDFIYVHKGFGPGAEIEVWCKPTYYYDDGTVLSGLVWVKCHKILIDPAGYVYDVDIAGSQYEWPEVPPENSLIENATVTALVRTGDEEWQTWNADESGQVNPQVTDLSTEDKVKVKGYFAFYVPSGQYQVTASAPGYADYISPILTVVDAPVFHNVGMKKVAEAPTAVFNQKYKKNRPAIFVLDQNYPNPFNPVTTMSFYLPVDCKVTLRVYDVQGKEVGTLINDDYKEAGKHMLKYDASSLSSGVYFYRLDAGKFTSTKKFILMK